MVNTFNGNVANLQVGAGDASSTFNGAIHGNATGTAGSGGTYISANAEGSTTTLTKVGITVGGFNRI